jgi:hypothetical protein
VTSQPAAPPVPAQSITPQSNTAEVGSPAWREAEAPGGVRSIGDTINKVGQWMGRAAQPDPDAPLQPIQHLASGVTKEAAKTVLGLSHMMGAHEDQQKSEQPSLSPGLETYGPWEGAGGWLETITEFMGGQKALEGLTIPERLAKISQVAKFLEKYPKMAAALGANARMGATAGGQTLVKTGGDTKAAGEAAALTAGSGLALEGAAGGVRNFLNNNAATRATVGGVETVVPGNVRKTIMKPEQQAGQEAIKRSAQDTLGQHLQEVNESRAIPPSPPALPARTGPFEFELQGPRTGEQTGGTLKTQDSNIARQHIANLNDVIDHPEFEKLPPEQQQQILRARTDAQQQMAQYNAHLQTLSPRANRPNFEQIDIPATVQRIGSYTEAAAHLEGIATDGYNSIADSLMLNDISGGKFNAIRNANKDAWEAYKGATSHEGLAMAENAIDATNQQMRDLLQNDIGGAVSEKELAGFNEAYGQAQTLKHIAAAVDGSFTGNTGSAAQPWEYHGFNGTRLASNLDRLVRRYGRPAIERSIGAHNLDTLYQVAELNRTDAGRAKFGATLTPVMRWLAKGDFLHVGAIGAGGLAGRLVGLPLEAGALGGMAASIIGKKVMNAVMTNPKIAENIIYAMDHAVQPKIYGPLIGSMIVQQESAKDQEQGEGEPQP